MDAAADCGQQATPDDETLLTKPQCDTPQYDGFVRDFLATNAAPDSKAVVKLARKLCPTWPIPKQEGRREDPTMVRVAVMDSSFNPPHYCHGAYLECMGVAELALAAAEGGREARMLDIDAFLLLLGSSNADKPLQGASLEQRMRMVDMLATTVAVDASADTWHLWKSRDQFMASSLHNMAIGMVNTPRFVDKCRAVRDVVQAEWRQVNSGKCQVPPSVLCYFAMGWDTLIRFFDTKYYGQDFPGDIDRFFGEGGRIAYSRRVGFPGSDVDAFFGQTLLAPYLQYMYELTLPKRVEHISSTDVRRAVCLSTQSVRDIPPRILEYINSSQLYRAE
ncbi:hypothetical protein GGI04_000461 [Coemansia thaxteri]|nr:hypothetical protein GGI04_000461 [Coemansia thaxteri]